MSRIMEDIKSGIKGIHGVGEVLRGNALAAADRAFDRHPEDPQSKASQAKNRAIAENGMRSIEGTNEIFARHRKGTHGPVDTTAAGAAGVTGATTSPTATGVHTYSPTATDTTFSQNMPGQHATGPTYGATGAHTHAPTAANTTFSENMPRQHVTEPTHGMMGNNTAGGAHATAAPGSRFAENMPGQHAAEPTYGATTSPTTTGTHNYAPSAADTTFSRNIPGQHVAEPTYGATTSPTATGRHTYAPTAADKTFSENMPGQHFAEPTYGMAESNTASGAHTTAAQGSRFAEHVPRQAGAQSQGYGTTGEQAFAHGAIPEAAPRQATETGTGTAFETGTRWA